MTTDTLTQTAASADDTSPSDKSSGKKAKSSGKAKASAKKAKATGKKSKKAKAKSAATKGDAPKKTKAAKAKAKTKVGKKAEPAAKSPKRRAKRAPAHPETILVTGASGGLGRLVCRKLHRNFQVVGVDRRPFPDRPKDVDHQRIDLRRKSAIRMIEKRKPDCIVHLGVIHNPQSNEAYRFNLEGTSRLLSLAEKLKVRKFIYLSTANLYGPSATSSGFLTEEQPLMAAANNPLVRDLISLDQMAQSFFWKRPETETVLLRPVHIVGSHLRNAPSKYLRLKTAPTILGFDPMIQVIHELDMVDAIEAALKKGARGIYNVVGPGQAPLSRLLDARRARQIPLPASVFRGTLDRMFRYHLTNFPASELEHLKYSCLVDGTRAAHDLKLKPRYSLRETLSDVDL